MNDKETLSVERGADSVQRPCSASLACVRWGERLLREHALDWQIMWTPGSTDGVTLFKTKTLHVHWPEDRPDYALMAHEIAHAVCGRPGHDSEFAHQYMKIVRRHFTPNEKADRPEATK